MTTDSTLTVAHTLAGLPVSDMGRAEDWYVKLFGKPADAAPMDILRDFRMSELATVQLVLDPDHAGGGLLTLDVSSIDDAVAGIQARGLHPQRDDTTSRTG
ncbi:MAG: VOC family protein [Geodermatophilaceae bacterium]|nr:VOC family protein [Geodermatophilaceae bacterium]